MTKESYFVTICVCFRNVYLQRTPLWNLGLIQS